MSTTQFDERYEILSELGRGSFGIVYLAQDRQLGRDIALKILHPALVMHPDTVRLFSQEAGVLAQLEHDNIVTVYDMGVSDDSRFIAMRVVHGRSLAQVLLDDGPQPPERVAQWFTQIAAGLDYAHAQGILHRDLKPSNLLWDEARDRILISDFGLARAVESSGGSSSDHKRQTMPGTVLYMAPEVVEGEKATRASDLYSLGCVLYELLRGEPPFTGDSPMSVMFQHVQTSAPALELPGETGQALARQVAALLAKDPAQRPVSAQAAVDALRDAPLASATLPTPPPAVTPRNTPGLSSPSPEHAAPLEPEQSSRRQPVLVGAVLAAFLLVAALAIVFLGPGRETPSEGIAVGVTDTATPIAVSTPTPASPATAPVDEEAESVIDASAGAPTTVAMAQVVASPAPPVDAAHATRDAETGDTTSAATATQAATATPVVDTQATVVAQATMVAEATADARTTAAIVAAATSSAATAIARATSISAQATSGAQATAISAQATADAQAMATSAAVAAQATAAAEALAATTTAQAQATLAAGATATAAAQETAAAAAAAQAIATSVAATTEARQAANDATATAAAQATAASVNATATVAAGIARSTATAVALATDVSAATTRVAEAVATRVSATETAQALDAALTADARDAVATAAAATAVAESRRATAEALAADMTADANAVATTQAAATRAAVSARATMTAEAQRAASSTATAAIAETAAARTPPTRTPTPTRMPRMPTPTRTPTPRTVVSSAFASDSSSLTIWVDSARTPILMKLGKAFQDEYGITVVVTEKGFGDIRNDFKVSAPAGKGPDIIIGAHDWLGELVGAGLLAKFSLGDAADQFLPAAVQGFTYDGVLYGMPYATENVGFVYNTDMVSEVPSTWTEVSELAAQLEADGVVKQGFIRQEGDPYHFFPIQTAFGGYVFGLTDAGYDPTDVGIGNKGSIAAATWLDQMVKDGHLAPNASVNYDIMHEAFGAGDAAMIVTGPWALPTIRASGVPYAVSVIPGEVQEAQPFLGIQGFMVSRFSKDPLLPQTFLQEFVANADTMQAIFGADPRPSAFLPVRDAIKDPDIAAFAEAGANGLAMPAIPEMSLVWDAWGNAITLVTQQRKAPDAAMKSAAEQIRAVIGR